MELFGEGVKEGRMAAQSQCAASQLGWTAVAAEAAMVDGGAMGGGTVTKMALGWMAYGKMSFVWCI
jgi:hypothetical protein